MFNIHYSPVCNFHYSPLCTASMSRKLIKISNQLHNSAVSLSKCVLCIYDILNQQQIYTTDETTALSIGMQNYIFTSSFLVQRFLLVIYWSCESIYTKRFHLRWDAWITKAVWYICILPQRSPLICITLLSNIKIAFHNHKRHMLPH